VIDHFIDLLGIECIRDQMGHRLLPTKALLVERQHKSTGEDEITCIMLANSFENLVSNAIADIEKKRKKTYR
jgi:hypothetical protein